MEREVMVVEKVVVIRKTTFIDMLRSMKVGTSRIFKTKDYKLSTATKTARRLKRNEGLTFKVTEKGMINQFRVERIS